MHQLILELTSVQRFTNTDLLTVLTIVFPVVTFIPILFVGGINELCAGWLLRLALRHCLHHLRRLLLRTTLRAFGPLRQWPRILLVSPLSLSTRDASI